MGIEIKIGQSRVAANGQRRVVCWRQAETGFGEPMAEEGFEVPPAADAMYVFLPGERRMPGKDLEPVKPAVLDDQEPSGVAEGVEAANQARRMFSDRVIHHRPPDDQLALPTARARKRGTVRMLMGTVNIPRVLSKRSVK